MKHVLSSLFVCAALVSTSACASYANSMPRVASGIEATKALWKTACEPEPIVSEKVCADAREGINATIDLYTEVNESL